MKTRNHEVLIAGLTRGITNILLISQFDLKVNNGFYINHIVTMSLARRPVKVNTLLIRLL